ncbi:MAG: carboxypeptidase-like regulatory domain-containing protein, partial [Syntrophothermus sp.]
MKSLYLWLKVVLVISAFSIIPLAGQSQNGYLEGTVKSCYNTISPNAIITISGTPYSSNSSGYFLIPLPPGNYTFTASAVGYMSGT